MAVNAQIIVSLRNQADPEVRKLAASFRDLSGETKTAQTNFDRLERQFQQLQQSEIRVATATGQYGRALQLISSEMAVAGQGTVRYNNLLVQQTQVEQRAERAAAQLAQAQSSAASGSNLASQATDSFKSNLLGLIGPTALVTAGFAAAKAGADSFVEAFTFKAQLDQTNAGIAIQLRGVRDSGVAFQQAAQFATRYKLTQQETTEAISESIPVVRSSKASIDEILSVFTRLTILKPGKTFADASRAISELQAGQLVSLEKVFNVVPDKAREMKKEIEGGADAIKVLDAFLTSSGVGMEALETRTRGAIGAMNDLKVAEEQLKIAQADLAQGPGTNFLGAATAVTKDTTRVLGGGGGSIAGNSTALIEANSAALLTFQATLLKTGSIEEAIATATRARELIYKDLINTTQQFTDIEDIRAQRTVVVTEATIASADALSKDAKEKLGSTIATARLAQQQAQLDRDSQLAAQGLLGAGNQALLLAQKYGIASDQAQFLIDKQRGVSQAMGALIDLQQQQTRQLATNPNALSPAFAGEQNNSVDAVVRLQEENKKAADKAAADAKRLADSENQLSLARAKSSAARIAILQREAAQTTDQADKNHILAQIEGERNSGAKAHTTELGKQLSLEERIRDAKESQLKASLDASAAIIHDRQQKRIEDQEIKTAQNILNSSRSSQVFKDAASDKLALIAIEQQQRILDINNKLATSHGQVINGRVFQSRQVGDVQLASPNGQSRPDGTALPIPQSPGGPSSVGLPTIEVLVTLDGAPIAANVVTRLRQGARASNAAGGGLTP